MTASHDDLNRSLGQVEGKLSAMEDRLDRIDNVLERIDKRLAAIERKETERRGAWKAIAAIASAVGAVVGVLFKAIVAHLS